MYVMLCIITIYLNTGQEPGIVLLGKCGMEQSLKLFFERCHNMYHLHRFVAETKQNTHQYLHAYAMCLHTLPNM